tara:strand:- start:4751 stop:4951 length:201 start_codon:yes stop_codon:yes gene_type:complete
MHPRYILTEVGGLGFENGLDESDDGETLTDVTLVYGQSLVTRLNEYQADDPERKLLCRFSTSDLSG